MLDFNELEMKFGPAVAYQCLVEIEKAARIPSWSLKGLDHAARLAYAIQVQDAANDNAAKFL